jgi:hypothetical protein
LRTIAAIAAIAAWSVLVLTVWVFHDGSRASSQKQFQPPPASDEKGGPSFFFHSFLPLFFISSTSPHQINFYSDIHKHRLSSTHHNTPSYITIMPTNDSKYIREVWAENLDEEMVYMRDLVEDYPYLSMVCI